MGAGLTGCTTARYLAESGRAVLVVDRAGIGAGASGRNGGFLLRRADAWIEARRAEAVEIYRELEDRSIGCGLRDVPLLLVGADEPDADHARSYAAAVGGTPADLSGDPWFARGLAAFVIEGSHVVDPYAATSAMAAAAVEAGARFEPGVDVERLLVRGDRVTGALASTGRVEADRVVVACGARVGQLLATAGVHLGLAAVRGWLFQTEPVLPPLEYAVEEAQQRMAEIGAGPSVDELAEGEIGPAQLVSLLMGARPGGSLVVGTSLNRSLQDDPEGASTVRDIAARARRIAPILRTARTVASWSGRRTMSPDGLPVVGPVPGVDGLDVVAAFSSIGMVTIPGTCRRF
ncbi:MAG: NAD(P)/FAD-dependent oxidoreductase, partial [Gaiellales bacterium]